MVTREQCHRALQKKFKAKADVENFGKTAFVKRYCNGTIIDAGSNPSPQHFIDANIARFLSHAEAKGQPGLDALGRESDIPSAAEKRRQRKQDSDDDKFFWLTTLLSLGGGLAVGWKVVVFALSFDVKHKLFFAFVGAPLLGIISCVVLVVILHLLKPLLCAFPYWLDQCEHGTRGGLRGRRKCPECDNARDRALEAEGERQLILIEQQMLAREQRRLAEDKLKREAWNRVHNLDHLRCMDPTLFEQFVLDVYQRLGWEVQQTRRGPDEGIDGLLRRGGELVVVQCKRYSKAKVSAPVLRDLLGVVTMEHANMGFLVTTTTFTKEARKWAKDARKLRLVDGENLLDLVKKAFQDVREAPAEYGFTSDHPSSHHIAQCPVCGMRVRIVRGRRGRFLGCTSYPRCRWTSDLPSVEPDK